MNTRTAALTKISLMVAVTAVMAQLAIPMPAGVPMTLQTLAVTFAGAILGQKQGTLAMVVYLLIGTVGVPVFSSFTGGAAVLVGPTGGFLWSFPIMAMIIGYGADKEVQNAPSTAGYHKDADTPSDMGLHNNVAPTRHKNGSARFWFFIILGTAINYFVGTAAFCYITGAGISAGIAACVIPFIPTTIIKALLGGILGLRIRKAVSETI